MSGIIGKKRASADVTTPPPGYVTQFNDTTGALSFKDETGAVTAAVSADSAGNMKVGTTSVGLSVAEVVGLRNAGIGNNTGTINEAQTLKVSGAYIGERKTLADGDGAGAELVWNVPQGRTAAAWCWGILPSASYN